MTDITHYRVRWEVDIYARTALAAAREAEIIMRQPIDGDPSQARVMDVRPVSRPTWIRLDLGKQNLNLATAPVLPPGHSYVRARSWKAFQTTFAPVEVRSGSYLVEPEDVPKGASFRDWWTVVDYDPTSNRLYLVPGFARANRLGFVQCLRPWGGNADDHPLYLYQ
jgi:hypothetical protein